MSWIVILALALSAFLIAILVLRMPRSGYALFGAALLFGLAGYAWQGNPSYAGSPTSASTERSQGNAAMVEARRAMFAGDGQAAEYVILADGFARRGQSEDAAGILRSAVQQNPDDAEGWLALANALVEHADGQITPAALVAFSRAEAAAPGHPGAGYFYGVALLRAGQPVDARAAWQDVLDNAPEGALWREDMEQQLERLDGMLEQIAAAASAGDAGESVSVPQ